MTSALSLFDDILPALDVEDDVEPGTETASGAEVTETLAPAVEEERGTSNPPGDEPESEPNPSDSDILGILNAEPSPTALEEALASIAALEQLSDAAIADIEATGPGTGLLGFDFDLWSPKPETPLAVVPVEVGPGTEVAVAPAQGNQIISATGKNTYGYQAALRVAALNRATPTFVPTAFTLMKADEIEAMSEATKAGKNQLSDDR